jgi:hypothetical protein
MTYENDIEVEFDCDGRSYAATADVVVTLEKEDIGPVGYHEHFESYVTQDVEIKNLKLGLLPDGEDFVEIPKHLKEAAETLIQEKASYKAEEAME